MISNITKIQTNSIYDKRIETIAKEIIDRCKYLHDESQDDQKLICDLHKSLSGFDTNTVLFGSSLRQYFSQHNSSLYVIYNKCVDEIMKSVHETNNNFFTQQHCSKEIFTFINNTVIQMLTNIQNVSYYMKHFDVIFSRSESLTTYLNMNLMRTYFIDKYLINEKTLLQIMDENLMETDLNCFKSISYFIECINYCYTHKIIDIPTKYISRLTNTRTIFFKLLNKFPDDIVNIMFQLFSHEISFTRDYKGFLSKRLLKKMTPEFIEREKQLLIKYAQFDPNGKKYIGEMKCQIDDVQTSIQLTQIFKNFDIVKTPLTQTSRKSNTIDMRKNLQTIGNIDNIVIDPSICNIILQKKDIWNIQLQNDTPKYNGCIDAYNQIFQKIYSFLGNNDTIVLDDINSTGVLNISFDGAEYKFLATLSQINVLTTIIDCPEIFLDDITLVTQYCKETVILILEGLCTCELIVCNDDKTFSINKNFFFEETNVSLISLLKFNEKFDEELLFDVLHIIIKNTKCDVQKICDEYEKQFGISNYDTIDSVVTHLIRGNVIVRDKTISDQVLFNNQAFEKMKQQISL